MRTRTARRPRQMLRFEQLEERVLLSFASPLLNVDGLPFSGVRPPDAVGDVGPNHYVQAINAGGGARFAIFGKNGVQQGAAKMDSLAQPGTPCADGKGDPVVVYDHLADRWVLLEFADDADFLCVYVSRTGTPTTNPSDWYEYQFETPNFPDYPKITVWPDAYYVGTNESDNPVYALERSAMLQGQPATMVRQTATNRPNWARDHLMPANLDGAPPPPGTPGLFVRQVDDEVTDPGSADPTRDYLEIWEFNVDFVTPGDSTFTLAQTIPIADFDYFVGASDRNDIPQPGTTQKLDALPHYIYWGLQYRVVEGQETLIGGFTVDANEDASQDFSGGTAEEQAGIRWFELRRPEGTSDWSLYQEGTYAPDAEHRWMGSVAMNGSGDIAVGYSVASEDTFPGLRYAGRRAGDPLGALPEGEHTIVEGLGSQQDKARWGDYSAMMVDPADDNTFWYTSLYIDAAGNWQTRIAALSFAPTPITVSADDLYGDGTNTGGNDTDIFELRRNGPLLEIYIDGTLSRSLLFDAVERLTIVGSSDNDTLIVDNRFGQAIPEGGIVFDGGGQGTVGDTLEVRADAGSGSYLPDPIVLGSGTVVAGGRSIRFSGLEPVIVTGFTEFTFVTPNSLDLVQVDQFGGGFDRITGTSGGVAFEQLRFSNIRYFAIDTATNDNPLGEPDDTVQFLQDLSATNLERVTVRTGAGDDVVDASAVQSVPLIVLGGGGDDVFSSGGANDVFDGGSGSDRLVWEVGDRSDRFTGGGGEDLLVARGNDLAQVAAVDADGTTAIVVMGLGVIQLPGVEQVNLDMFDGNDTALVSDLSGTSVRKVFVDLGAGTTELLEVTGTSTDDLVTLDESFGNVVLTGLPAEVTLIEPRADQIVRFVADAGFDTLQLEGIATTVTVDVAAGSIEGVATPTVEFFQTERLVFDGTAVTTKLTASNARAFQLRPGTAPDRGELWADGLQIDYRGMTEVEKVELTGTADFNEVLLFGTDGSDSMRVSGTLLTRDGMADVRLLEIEQLTVELLDGDDVFRAYPTTNFDLQLRGGDPSASDVLEVVASALPDSIVVDLAAGTITGTGAVITFDGFEQVSIDGDSGTDALTVLGTNDDERLNYRPTSPEAGAFWLEGQPVLFSFGSIEGLFTVDLRGAIGDELVLVGTNNHDVITVDSPNRDASVENAAGVLLKPVRLADSVETIIAQAGLGNDTVLVIPAPATANAPNGQPYNLSVVVDGGPPGASDALVVAQSGGVPLPATDFAVVYRGREADQGRVRLYRNAVAIPDIVYEDIEIVSPITDPTVGRRNNLLIAGPDQYESNEYLPTAAFIGALEQVTLRNLVIFPAWGEHRFVPSDEDWFRVVAAQTGTLDVRAYFRMFDPALFPAGGDLQVELYDEQGNLLAGNGPQFGTNDTDDDERIRIPAVAGETYYIRVFGAPSGSPTSPVVNAYDLSIINEPPPVPYGLELDDLPADPNYDCSSDPPSALNSDTGRDHTDNVTCDNSPTIFLRLDDAILLQDVPGNATPGTPPDEVIPIPFNPSLDPDDVTPGYRVAVFVEGDPQQPGVDPQEPVGFAQPTAVAGVYRFDFDDALNGAGMDLADGSHFISAKVELIDPANPTARGFGARSELLEIVVDTVAPPVAFGEPAVADDGLHPESDTGLIDRPETFRDRITSDTRPTWWGIAEADSIVRLYADLNGNGTLEPGTDLFLGQTVAVPEDGNNQFPRGVWEFRTEIDLNDPAYFPEDGHRRIFVTAEDLAGNVSTPDVLDLFLDTRGPRVVSVEFVPLMGGANVPVFTPKPLAPTFGPTPLTEAIDVTFEDEPVRVDGALGFVYPAVFEELAVEPGNYRLVGDANGHILIRQVLFMDSTVAGDVGRTTVRLVFATPLPDDRYTLTITDRLADQAGNRLDGDVQATGPGTSSELLPSGDGVPGDDFVGRFTVDSRPEIGVFNDRLWFIDLNGNGVFDPDNTDATNRDIVWRFGEPGDWPVVGDWDGDGFDEIGVYGLRGGTYRFELDVNGNGTLDGGDAVFVFGNINAQPIAGDWNGDGIDEVGLYFNRTWWLDLNGNYSLEATERKPTNMAGHPVAGDWDGDGDDDVGVYRTNDNAGTPQNRWLLDLDDNYRRNAGDLVIVESPPLGGRKRPVAADWNARGTAKTGLFKINPRERDAEWLLDVDRDGRFEPPPTGTPGIPLVDQDIFYRFGDRRSEPIVGNFDPPPRDPQGTVPDVSDQVGKKPGQAYRLQVGDEPTVLRSTLADGKDRNWYVFRAVRNGRVAIDITTPLSPLDPMVRVQQGRKVIARNGNYNRTVDSHVEFAVRRGRQYRILVRSQRNTAGSYLIAAQYLRAQRDDHAASRAQATLLAPQLFGTRTLWLGAGRIERARDRDMFRFDVSQTGSYRISIDNLTVGLDTVITIFGPNGGVLSRFDTAEPSNGQPRYERLLELDAGRYWVRVEGHAGLRGRYELQVDAAIADLLDDTAF